MLGKRLVKLRGETTQEEVATAIGISRARYAHYERGRSEPNIDVLNKMAQYFNVSIDYLLGYTNDQTKKDEGVTNASKAHTIALQQVKKSVGQYLDIVYLPVIGNVPIGTPLLTEENIETYLPYPAKEYDPDNHFIVRVQDASMKNAGIIDGDLVIIRQQKIAEDGQIVAVRLRDDGIILKKFYKMGNKIILQSCNESYGPIELDENVTLIGVAISVTKKLDKKK